MNRSQVQHFRELIRILQNSILKMSYNVNENMQITDLFIDIIDNIDDVLKKILKYETNDDKMMIKHVDEFIRSNENKINDCKNKIIDYFLINNIQKYQNSDIILLANNVFESISKFNKYISDFYKGIIPEKNWKHGIERKNGYFIPLTKSISTQYQNIDMKSINIRENEAIVI